VKIFITFYHENFYHKKEMFYNNKRNLVGNCT